VHPSTLESLGIVLLEAFMAGTPALVHAGSEVLQWQCRRSGAGLWFRNYPEFEEELVRLLDDGNLRRAMGAAGREYVRREYAWDVVEERFEDALASL
jgi:glycosyltransferase involved in cell wall biosynthesis